MPVNLPVLDGAIALEEAKSRVSTEDKVDGTTDALYEESSVAGPKSLKVEPLPTTE